MRILLLGLVAALTAIGASAFSVQDAAVRPDFSGCWAIDVERSAPAAPGRTYNGSARTLLHQNEQRLRSQIRSTTGPRVRLFWFADEPPAPAAGEQVSLSRWDRGRLISEPAARTPGGPGTIRYMDGDVMIVAGMRSGQEVDPKVYWRRVPADEETGCGQSFL